MMDIIHNLLSIRDFTPRRYDGKWTSLQIWLHTTSDLLIWLATISILLVLGFYLWRRRAVLPFRWQIVLFAVCIFCWGTTHLLDALMFDWPVYRLSGLVKGITAAVSWLTVAALVPTVLRVVQVLDTTGPNVGSGWDQADVLGRPQRYMLAGGLVGLSLLARFGFDHVLGEERGYMLPLLAVMASAGYGGFGPGLFATLLGGVGYTLLFIDLDSVLTGPQAITHESNAALFVFCGLVASTFGQAQRSARMSAESATADLHESNRLLTRSQWDTVEALTQLDAFLTHAPVGLAFYDADLKPVRVNKYLAGTDGRSKVVAQAFPTETVAAFRGVLTTGSPLQEQEVHGLAGPDTVWHISAFPARDPLGVMVGLAVVAQDVTERRRAEEAAQAAEERFAFVRRTSGVGFWYSDLPFDVLQWDERVKEQFHLPPDAHVTIDTFYQHVHPDDRDATRAAIERSIAERQPYDTVYRTVHPETGEVKWVRAVGRTVYAADGTPAQFDGITIDVSDSQKAAAALRESEERYRALIELSPQMVWTADPAGKSTYFSQSWHEYTGQHDIGDGGESWSRIVHPDYLVPMSEAWEAAVAGGSGQYEFETPLRRASDGTDRWHLCRARLVRDDSGRSVRWVGVAVDIDDHKRTEIRERLLGDLVAATQPLADPTAVTVAAVRLASQHFRVSRCLFCDIDPTQEHLIVSCDSVDGVASVAGVHRFHDLGTDIIRQLRAGQTVKVCNVAADGRTQEVSAAYRAIETASLLCVPLLNAGRLTALFALQHRTPLDWTAADQVVFEQMAEQTWVAVERTRVARELAASEARFRGLTDTTPQVIWEADPVGRITFVNRYWEEYTGQAVEEVTGWSSYIRSDHLPRVTASWQSAMQGAAEYEECYPFRRRDGSFRWFISRGRLLRHSDGTPDRWVGTSIDVHDRVEAEEALAATQRTLTMSLAIANASVYTWDAALDQATTRSAHPARPELLATSRPHTLAQRLAAIHPSDQDGVVAEFEAAKRSGKTYAVQFRVGSPDAGWRWVESRGQFEYASDGTPVRAIGVRMDIHDRKTAEEAARRADREFRAMADSIPQLVFNADSAGRVTYFNTRWRDYTGLGQPDVLANWWQQVVHPIDAPALQTSWLRALQERAEPFSQEVRLRREVDGVYRWHLTVLVPLRNPAGGVDQWIGSLSDVHDLKSAEEAVRASEMRFRQLVEAVPNLVWVTDANGRVTQLNRQWVAYTGRQLGDLFDDGWTDLVHPDDAPVMLANWRAAVKHRAPYADEFRFRVADGSYRWQLARGTPVAGTDGRLSQWFGTHTDIDDQKRAAELLEAQVRERTTELARSNSELEKFAYVASHDLQEPLRKVQAFGDRLAKRFADGLGADGRGYIERMQSSAARMQTLIQDLLAFSRVSTRHCVFVPVPLGPLVFEVLSDLESLTSRTEAAVTVDELPIVYGDPIQLRQLFQNLLANACKFHRPGRPPTVKLVAQRLERLTADDEPPPGLPIGWRLQVSDDGIGFEQKYVERIFEVFQRLHGRDAYEGTGIGLAICRKIVERHGGIITARGRQGVGAVFVVDLPDPPGDAIP